MSRVKKQILIRNRAIPYHYQSFSSLLALLTRFSIGIWSFSTCALIIMLQANYNLVEYMKYHNYGYHSHLEYEHEWTVSCDYQVSQYHLWAVRHTYPPSRGRVLLWVFLHTSMKQSLNINLTGSTVRNFPIQILSIISLDTKITKISFLSLPLPFIARKRIPETTDDNEQGAVLTTYHWTVLQQYCCYWYACVAVIKLSLSWFFYSTAHKYWQKLPIKMAYYTYVIAWRNTNMRFLTSSWWFTSVFLFSSSSTMWSWPFLLATYKAVLPFCTCKGK